MVVLRDLLRQSFAAARVLLVLTVLLGVLYPAAVWAVGRAVPDRADGSLLRVDGQVVGSRLLGQTFEGPTWFHPRPSAGSYDGLASAPSNLGPSNPDLVAAIEERRAAVAAEEGVEPAAVPPDAVTASGSGLDPHVSPAYADLQVARVARERGLPVDQVRRLVEEATSGRVLGYLGEPTVNVLELNASLPGAD
ncbi:MULTISPECIES: potassium-transporting ATPase subunit KdpC [unclassified Aeromicrobium]|uniref:potassium-transporting ATPase subunit KdpC n=1 Tax=unclassified Aeromicrobium TaxID=2633570 RepID=UPI0006F333AA|nr:potassium transporter KtrA [Aeromicrobium sp. Leaf289]KQP85259.1 potassium transporter KtrA [Aeromicrobium sp. Leaf291]